MYKRRENKGKNRNYHCDHFPWLFEKPFEHIIVQTKILEQSGSKWERLLTNWLMSLAIIVIFFLISVDPLLRSVWTGCLKGRSIAVMILNRVLNNQGTIPNPQYWRSVTRNKYLTVVSWITFAVAGVRTVQPHHCLVSTGNSRLLIPAYSPIYVCT